MSLFTENRVNVLRRRLIYIIFLPLYIEMNRFSTLFLPSLFLLYLYLLFQVPYFFTAQCFVSNIDDAIYCLIIQSASLSDIGQLQQTVYRLVAIYRRANYVRQMVVYLLNTVLHLGVNKRKRTRRWERPLAQTR